MPRSLIGFKLPSRSQKAAYFARWTVNGGREVESPRFPFHWQAQNFLDELQWGRLGELGGCVVAEIEAEIDE